MLFPNVCKILLATSKRSEIFKTRKAKGCKQSDFYTAKKLKKNPGNKNKGD